MAEASEDQGARAGGRTVTKLVVATVATLLWVGTSLAVAGVVEQTVSVTAVNVGVPVLGLLFSYHVFVHEGDREWATVVGALLAVTSAVALFATFVQEQTVTLVANVLVLLGMFALVAFLWR